MMNSNLNAVVVIFLLISLGNDGICGDTIPALKNILSKEYSFEFSVKQPHFIISHGRAPKNVKGIVERKKDSIYSKIKTSIGIARDSIVFYLDNDSKIINISSSVMST